MARKRIQKKLSPTSVLPAPMTEVPCTCSGENPNCMHCDGLGIIRGRRAPPVVYRSEAQIVRQAVEESARVGASNVLTMESFEKKCLSHLRRLMPAHHCAVRFAPRYPFLQLTPGAIAYRTAKILTEAKGRVVSVTWQDPEHADLIVHRRNATAMTCVEAKIEFDRTGAILSTTFAEPVTIKADPRPVHIKRLTPLAIAQQKIEARAQAKAAAKAKKAGVPSPMKQGEHRSTKEGVERKNRNVRPEQGKARKARHSPSSKTGSPFNNVLGEKLRLALLEQADISAFQDEREFDATRGRHVFREYGSGQFGSGPSHDDYDN